MRGPPVFIFFFNLKVPKLGVESGRRHTLPKASVRPK